MRTPTPLAHAGAFLIALGLVACSGDDGSDTPPTGDTDSADTDSGTDTDTGTSARDIWLDRSHAGWNRAACRDCHEESEHDAGLVPYECVACHGNNGAEPGHTSAEPCARCHDAPHGEGFPDPEACTTCHASP